MLEGTFIATTRSERGYRVSGLTNKQGFAARPFERGRQEKEIWPGFASPCSSGGATHAPETRRKP